MFNIKSLIKTICFITLLSIFTGCMENSVKITKINFLYPDSFYYTPLIGREVERWGDTPPGIEDYVDNIPSELDLSIEIDNPNFMIVKETKIHLEFWLAKTKNILNEDNFSRELIEKMRDTSTWILVWQKELVVMNVKSNEKRKVKIEGLKFAELKEKMEKGDEIVMKFKGVAICDRSKKEKVIPIDIKY